MEIRRIVLIICGLLVLASIGCSAAKAAGEEVFRGMGTFDQERFGAMQPRMEAMRALGIDWFWTRLSFALELTEAQEQQVRELLKDPWERREQMMAEAEESGDADWVAIADKFRDMKKNAQGKLEEQQENRMSQFQRRDRVSPF